MSVASGVAATAAAPLLGVVSRYRDLNEHRARMRSDSALTPRSMPALDRNPTFESMGMRSWASVRGVLGTTFTRRSSTSSYSAGAGGERSPADGMMRRD